MNNSNFWKLKSDFVLASASKNRRALLESVRLCPSEIISPEINEEQLPNELPTRYVKRIAENKAKAVADLRPGKTILAADTVLAVGRRLIRKAYTEEEARANLMLLSGRKHRVLTGIAVVTPTGKLISKVNTSCVTMKKLDETDIKLIIESNEWKGVAGYQIEGVLSAFVKQMSGSYSSIVGIPVYETVQILRGVL